MNVNPKKNVSDNKIDVQSLMDEIRERIRKDYEQFKDRRPEFRPYSPDHNRSEESKAGDLILSDELKYLNEQYAIAHHARIAMSNISSHRPGFIGKTIVFIKRKMFGLLANSLLKEYFDKEREFSSQLVRFLNHAARYIDARDADNFWEIIRKIDVDVTRALERIERINDEQTGTVRSFERQLVDDLNKVRHEIIGVRESVSRHDADLKVLDSVTRGLEAIVARASSSSSSQPQFTNDESYLLLENRYRGSEKEIGERVAIYPPLFSKSKLPVLEIGGGRGELQELFKKQGISSYSVDIDGAMVAVSKEKGLDARHGDALAHLSQLPDKSIGGVIAVQVVEHLTMKQLETLFQLCRSKVVEGGTIIFETINPKSVLALSSNYFRDPTHVWPLHPDTLSYMMTLQGLKIKEVRELSPVPPEGGIQQIPEEEYFTPRWRAMITSINRNFSRLHQLLYGSQDYCVIAEV